MWVTNQKLQNCYSSVYNGSDLWHITKQWTCW